jgi:hypothetical protein
MANQKLVDYIIKLQGAGIQKEEIVSKLKNVGWPQPLIDEAYAQIGASEVPVYEGPGGNPFAVQPEQPKTIISVAAVSSPAPAQELPPKEPAKKFPVPKIAIFIALFLVFAAGIVWGSYQAVIYYFPSPEAVMERMMEKMAQAKTMESQGKIDAEMIFGYAGAYSVPLPKDATSDNSRSQKINLTVDFETASDVTDANNTKSSVGLKISEDKYFNGDIDIDVIGIGKTFYAKFDTTSENLSDAYKSSGLVGKWLEIDYEKISKQLAKDNPQVAAFVDKNYKMPEMSADQLARVRALALKTKIVTAKKQLGDEAVSGADCRHYEVDINKDDLREYVRGVGAIMQDQVSQAQIGQMLDIIGKADFSGIEIWVAKSDFTLRRVKGNMKYHDSYLGLIDYSMSFDWNVDYRNIGKPVNIEAPANAKSLYDVLNDSMTSSRAKARDAKRQSDMRQMVSAEEMYYGENDRYYTCSASGGDCKGKANNLPASISNYLTVPKDPTGTGTSCGKDYIYCGLDNTKSSQKFCFYAKLEGGGFYTASDAGNYKRMAAPRNFEECGKSN